MDHWKELYDKKVIKAMFAIKMIEPGSRIFIGTGCGQPQVLVGELVKSSEGIVDAEVYHLLTHGIAPYIAGVFPLVKKDGIAEKAQEVIEDLKKDGFDVFYDQAGSIGKRYARADEIGCSFAITVDYVMKLVQLQ